MTPDRPRIVALMVGLGLLAYAGLRWLPPQPDEEPAGLVKVHGPTVEATPALIDLQEASGPYQPARLPVIPTPKKLVPGQGEPLTVAHGKVKLLSARGPLQDEAVRQLQDALGTPPADAASLTLSEDNSLNLPAQGYRLEVSQAGFRLIGKDAHGLYYGVQTVLQLLDQGAVPALTIEDWPSLSTRAVHWTGGAQAGPFQRKLIERVLAPLKINTILYETEFAQWKSQPGLHDKERSTPLHELRQTVACARQNGIETIPLLQTLSHCRWLFANHQNADLALPKELVGKPHPADYHYDPRKARSHQVIVAVLEEIIEIFQPTRIHLGHDEVGPLAATPQESCQLFLQDIAFLHQWLARRKIESMIWGDMLLSPDEVPSEASAPSRQFAALLREGLPKDIWICDWHYGDYSPVGRRLGTQPPATSYPSLPFLQKAGFQVLACPASYGGYGNIRTFADEAIRSQAGGLIETTWVGYNFSSGLLQGWEYRQLVAFVAAAEAAWSGGKIPTWSAEEAFRSRWDPLAGSQSRRPGFAVSLKSLSNAHPWVWGPAPTPPLFLHPLELQADDRPVPSGQVQLLGTTFLVDGAVLLCGPANPPGSWPGKVRFKLNRKVSQLHFLLGATYESQSRTKRVAQLDVSYADGQQECLELLYGRHILGVMAEEPSGLTPTVWKGQLAGSQARLRRLIWKNPHPDSPLEWISLSTEGYLAAPLLLGITGITEEAEGLGR